MRILQRDSSSDKKPRSVREAAAIILCLVLAGAVVAGCAARNTLSRLGQDAEFTSDWDAAVEYHQQALQEDPDNPAYRIALQRAMLNASRAHLSLAQEFEANEDLSNAVREYRLAAEFESGNTQLIEKARELK